jgi:hypothetical protein
MTSDTEDDLPVSHAIADGWAEFAERVLPSVSGTEHAPSACRLSLRRDVRASADATGDRGQIKRGSITRIGHVERRA